MKPRILLMVGLMVLCGIAGAEMVKTGPVEITINGGERGNVLFPHQQHQTVLKDCNVCHAFFPQKIGGISEMIEKGALEKKQIMNEHCKKCHREKKNAGEKAGPIACSECHKKPNQNQGSQTQ